MDNLVKQEYWDNFHKFTTFSITPKNSAIRKIIEKYIPKQMGDCIEIGCFPGQFLAIFGELGYTLHGIDFNPRVDIDLPNWLKKMGFHTGNFYKYDFTSYNNQERYDIVCSFGFIEHFPNWELVVRKHMQLLKKNGYLIITTPNFKGGIQNFLHKTLDNTNYKRHLISSMDPKKWEKILLEEDYEILYSGYFGGFKFWIDFTDNQNIIIKIIAILIIGLSKYFGFIFPDNIIYSPYCGIIARKK